MTQKEIIERELSNTESIYLYLEGSFYKAYERSAFAFFSRIKEYRVLRKESKTLGRDILYIGFPQAALDRTVSNCIVRRIDDKTLEVVLSYPISSDEFELWRDAQEVEMASRALVSPYTRVIEKAPVYKTSYDILTRIILIAKNISKNMQTPFGTCLKELAYRSCHSVRSLYDYRGDERVAIIDKILPINDEISFLLQILKDQKEISLNSFAILSEQLQSVSRQLLFLQKKVNG